MKLGLWSVFPDAPKYRAYREVICKTFGNVLLNDHSRNDILHAPVLMAAEEYFRKNCPTCKRNTPEWLSSEYQTKDCPTCENKGTVTDERELFANIEHCWIQESWSASINPKGAWFCEVAGALSDLFDGPEGWKVEEGWWKRVPKDFREQMEWACKKCGAALPIERNRSSQDNTDDISPGNLERLKAIKSKKIAKGEYEVHSEFKFDPSLLKNHGYPNQTYKDFEYRQGIAAKYGIFLTMNSRGYWEPHLKKNWKYEDYKPPVEKPTLFQILKAQS
jgi:hypothetical protein